MAKRVSRPFAKNRDVRLASVGNKGARVPTALTPSESARRRPSTMACSNFHILLESNNVTTRRAWKSCGAPLPRPVAATCPQILSHPRSTIYQRARLASRLLARLDLRVDRGNNDRMERTMGAHARAENAASDERRVSRARADFRDSADP